MTTASVRKQEPKAIAPSVSKPASTALTAAVLGGSISGLMASLVLNKIGFAVTLYEKRADYKRNIQWTCRQGFIDYLSWLDPAIAKGFYDELLSPISNGYRFLSDRSVRYPDGAYKHEDRNKPRRGNGKVPKKCYGESLNVRPVGIVRAREFEEYLLKEVEKLGITTVEQRAPDCEKVGNRFALLLGKGRKRSYPALIVVCEGANSTTRKAAGIDSIKLSRNRPQVSGEVQLERHGMVTHYQHAKRGEDKPSVEVLLSALLSTDDKKLKPDEKTTCWVIGDVSRECLNKLDNLAENQIEKEMVRELKKIAARTMLETHKNVLDVGVSGAVDKVKMFELQAKISDVAFAGSNLVLAGDAVGEGHWSVGGGMHVAGLCHQRRLYELATVILEAPTGDHIEALKTYSQGVLDDTKTWISLGIKDYYPSIPEDVLLAVFKPLMDEAVTNPAIRDKVPDMLKEQVAAVYLD